jgi:hypothetical protein
LSSIGIDIGKDVFHRVGFNNTGQVVLRRKIMRLALDITVSWSTSHQAQTKRIELTPHQKRSNCAAFL